MKILGIDTSSNVASVAYLDRDTLVCEYTLNYKLTHSQTLMPMVDEVCRASELDLNDIDAIAISSGPGSFTGLRIGSATAKGLAHGLNKPIIPVPTLDGLAYNIHYTGHLICPIMDARRQQVYTALYEWQEGELIRQTEHLAIPLADLMKMLEDQDKKVIFIGDGVPVFRQVIEERLGSQAYFGEAHLNRQRASAIAALGMKLFAKGQSESFTDHTPMYIRKSQAEREYEEKQGK